MLKRFSWKENDLYSIQLTNELYIIAQLLKKPYVAFFNIQSQTGDFDDKNTDLNIIAPMGICMVLKDFFRKCAIGKIKKNVSYKKDIKLPELFISPDRDTYFERSKFKDEELIYNLVRIDPEVGGRGIMGDEIVHYNIPKNDPDILQQYEIVGYNTGYELVRRLILSVENNRWIDPLKEKWLLGEDKYPIKTVDELWQIGVPKYE